MNIYLYLFDRHFLPSLDGIPQDVKDTMLKLFSDLELLEASASDSKMQMELQTKDLELQLLKKDGDAKMTLRSPI